MTSDAGRAALDLVDRFWERMLEVEPLLGTQVGDERHDDQLPDPSDAGLARRETLHRSALEELERIDRDRLPPGLPATLDVLEAIARRDLDAIRYRLDRFGAVTHLWGPGQLLGELGSLQRADTPERLDRYVARLRAIPDYLRAIERIMDEAVHVGQTTPRLVVDRTIGQVERLLSTPIEDLPAMAPVERASPADRDRVASALADRVHPAYGSYVEALRRYRPHARETIGVCALPDGEAMYASMIIEWTSLPLEAGEIHQIGVDEMERILEERRDSAVRLGKPDPAAAIAEYQASGRNTANSPEDMVRLAEEQVARGWEATPKLFGRLPSNNCEVRPVEAFREADMPFAYYQPPSADGSRVGIYYVNTSDLTERPLHHLATTTFHEANPGHHFQLSIEQEMGDRPALRRFGGILGGSAFIEGWGLYSERLADEMELFQDEYERIGMLDAQAWRAARLIVDTGIHAFGWDRERAVAKLEESGVPRLDAEVETDRYVAMPGQALSYKIGQLEIERRRRVAMDREGSAFSLPDFHDRLLALGSLPLLALRREMETAYGR